MQFKWDHHAELIAPNLHAYFRNAGTSLVDINAEWPCLSVLVTASTSTMEKWENGKLGI